MDKFINQIIQGDCLEVMKGLPDNSIDSIVTDPPYELNFMDKTWDNTGVAYKVELWQECLRVLKPGGHMLAFGGTRTYHRMAVAIEDAGFEVRDTIHWAYGSGFPKNYNVSKGFDKRAGAEREVVGISYKRTGKNGTNNEKYAQAPREDTLLTAPATDLAKQYEGYGTALKPAHEPIILVRKPLDGTVLDTIEKWGTGVINIDGCRAAHNEEVKLTDRQKGKGQTWNKGNTGLRNNPTNMASASQKGRFPANLIHDGSDEVKAEFPDETNRYFKECNYDEDEDLAYLPPFYYTTKASKKDRNSNVNGEQVTENKHPTVKPTSLKQYLCRLITPKGGTILDPFAGSGSTLVSAKREGFNYIGIEKEDIETAKERLKEQGQTRLF